jgi:Flp pilus assembly protein TadG
MGRDERGLSESVQWAILWPLLMLLTLGIIQAGIFLHGRNVAQRAATAAVDAARGSYGSAADAQHLGESIASSGGLRSISVRVQRTGTTATAEISADAPVIFDLGVGLISETAVAPLERVTQP